MCLLKMHYSLVSLHNLSRWQLALLSMRARRYYQRTGKKITINGNDTLEGLVNVERNSFKGNGGYSMELVCLELHGSMRESPLPHGTYGFLRLLTEFQQPEFEGYGFKANKGVCENSSNEIKKTTDAPIIEDWVSDCDEDDSEVMVLKSDNVQHKPEQANQPKKVSQNLRNNRTKWNEIKTQKLGVGFQITKKACFVCGSFNHLIKDCDFHDKKMVQKPVLNNVKKGTGQKKVRPVWNNAMRVNHQNFSNSRRNFVPTAVLTKSGIVPVSAARPINTAAPKSFHVLSDNVAVGNEGIYVVKYQHAMFGGPKIKVNSVNTAKGNKVTSAVGEQGINAVKSLAYWVWRPKIKADSSLELKGYLINNGYADLVKMLYG
ncbi:hypothetical protein Tco_0039282 [Tanacetum coccineum]